MARTKQSNCICPQQKPKTQEEFKVSLHLESQKFNTETKVERFSPELVELQKKRQEVELKNPIVGFGFNHTEGQSLALEAIQKLFSRTHYKGNKAPLKVNHRTIRVLPMLQITQSDYLKVYGAKQNSPGEIERAIKNLETLGKQQYFFRYERLAINAKGTPERDSKGNYKKEVVEVIDTVITLKKIYDTDNFDTRKLQYYEIEPSPIFVDQIGIEELDEHNKGNYFLLKPAGWREEIKLLSDTKISKYTYLFINWLMVKFEEMRRANTRYYTINYTWQTIATQLKVPEITINRTPSRVKKDLLNACAIAQQLGYLTSYDPTNIASLHLNTEKFIKPHICNQTSE